MIYYKNIPHHVNEFVHSHNVDEILAKMNSGHDWKFVDTEYFLTDFAKKWFSDRGMILKSQSALFKADVHGTSLHGIHSDSHINDTGINFILSGAGEMQWVEPSNAIVNVVNDQGTTYPMFDNATEIKILDKWSGTCGIVNVKVPHRIVVTSDVPRICFSIRLDLTKCQIYFNQACDLI
jgi:hypothetical protein